MTICAVISGAEGWEDIEDFGETHLDFLKQYGDFEGNDSNLLIVFYVQIMPDDFVMQLHRF